MSWKEKLSTYAENPVRGGANTAASGGGGVGYHAGARRRTMAFVGVFVLALVFWYVAIPRQASDFPESGVHFPQHRQQLHPNDGSTDRASAQGQGRNTGGEHSNAGTEESRGTDSHQELPGNTGLKDAKEMRDSQARSEEESAVGDGNGIRPPRKGEPHDDRYKTVEYEAHTLTAADLVAKGGSGAIATLFAKSLESIYFEEYKPATAEQPQKISVLLLHGAKYDSATWRSIFTPHELSLHGFRVIALDLPGFGNSVGQVPGVLRAPFIKAVADTLDLGNFALVSPSMSGAYSLPYLQSVDAKMRLAAYVPVAPISVDAFNTDAYAKVATPALVVWGTNDKAGAVRSETLLKMPNATPFEMQNAPHACYLKDPQGFNRRLVAFLESNLLPVAS